jgi:hypothetical protein
VPGLAGLAAGGPGTSACGNWGALATGIQADELSAQVEAALLDETLALVARQHRLLKAERSRADGCMPFDLWLRSVLPEGQRPPVSRDAQRRKRRHFSSPWA